MRNDKPKICPQCDSKYNSTWETKHLGSRWHQIAVQVRELRAEGKTYAYIARVFRVTRSYIQMMLDKEGL
jgi:hypothetical protein